MFSLFLPFPGHVVVDPEAEEVDKLDDAEDREPTAEAHESANVGEEVNHAVELTSLATHEVEVLEEDVQDTDIFLHIGVVLVLGLCIWSWRTDIINIFLFGQTFGLPRTSLNFACVF